MKNNGGMKKMMYTKEIEEWWIREKESLSLKLNNGIPKLHVVMQRGHYEGGDEVSMKEAGTMGWLQGGDKGSVKEAGTMGWFQGVTKEAWKGLAQWTDYEGTPFLNLGQL